MEGVITSVVMIFVGVSGVTALLRLKLENKVLKEKLQLAENECEWQSSLANKAVNTLRKLEREIKDLRNALAAKPAPTSLSPGDLKRLISLCHPDKHGGKPMAVEMTQKLLSLRG